jgi:hypothetical protein
MSQTESCVNNTTEFCLGYIHEVSNGYLVKYAESNVPFVKPPRKVFHTQAWQKWSLWKLKGHLHKGQPAHVYRMFFHFYRTTHVVHNSLIARVILHPSRSPYNDVAHAHAFHFTKWTQCCLPFAHFYGHGLPFSTLCSLLRSRLTYFYLAIVRNFHAHAHAHTHPWVIEHQNWTNLHQRLGCWATAIPSLLHMFCCNMLTKRSPGSECPANTSRTYFSSDSH